MAKYFGESERRIKSLFQVGSIISWNGRHFQVELSGKPVCSSGEPKTDIYVLLTDTYSRERHEVKISFKQKNAEFIENKTNAQRAESILGINWKDIICSSTQSIMSAFDNKPLIFRKGSGRTKKGAITLGWKFELLNVKSGNLSGRMNLNHSQLIDVYSGTSLPEDKRNSLVNDKKIPNSGVANYIVFSDVEINSAVDVLNNLISIEDYVSYNPNMYFACKALNYRSFEDKYDGDRPLAVYVDWGIVDGKLNPTLKYDNPLIIRGNEVAGKLMHALNALNIQTTDDIFDNMVTDTSKICG